MRLDAGPYSPRQGKKLSECRAQVWRDLGLENVYCGRRIVVRSIVANIADDSDDLPRGVFKVHSTAYDASSHSDALANRVGVRPELFGHRLVDDDNRRAARVLIRENSSAQQRNLEDVEIARRNEAEPSSS